VLFAYAKSSTYQSLYSTSCLLDFEQEKIREVGHLANPPTHQCANFHGNYWKACDPWVSDLPVSQNCWVPFLCIAICVNRGVEPGTSTPAGQPAMSPGKIHQLLARHVDFKCIRGRTGTINWETPWMIFSRPKAWWKNQGRFCWCPRLWGRQKLKIGIVRCEKTQVSSFQDVPTRHFTYWQFTAIIETQTLTL